MNKHPPDDFEKYDSTDIAVLLLRMFVLGALIFLMMAIMVVYLHETHLSNLLVWLQDKMPDIINLLHIKHQYL